jgi:mono/diheme cytochrome c family protein
MRRLLAISGVAVLSLLFLGVSHRIAHAGMPVTSKLMDPHMEITLRRLPESGDRERADAIVADAKQLVAKYANVADAERDGYTKFLPNIELPQEHFTNAAFAAEAWAGTFDAKHPTSLIYTRDATGLHIAGVMYTASNMVSEADLDRRVPMSIGTWHRHVNLCRAPVGTAMRDAYFGEHPKFGLKGSIWTRDACDEANGSFSPIEFGWMIHVWPSGATQAAIWSIHGDDSAHDMVGEHEHHGAMGDAGGTALVAAGTLPIPLDHLPAVAVASGDAKHGAAVFAQSGASCHGAAGRAGPDAPQLAAQGLAAGQVAFMVRNPSTIDVTSGMPQLVISDGDLADVSAYVSQLK